jgi:hypothetical protein
MLRFLLLLSSQIIAAIANTEKTIFLGPSNLRVPAEHPSLEDLHLDALSPNHWSLRTHIQAQFPTNTSKHGQSSWLLLHGLREGQRYEVRICWAATVSRMPLLNKDELMKSQQPTAFQLDAYELPTVFETPDLITSLAKYSESRQPKPIEAEEQKPSVSPTDVVNKPTFEDTMSILFLHILAAADYFTMNQTLMEQVPPVFVDIILDPYVLNIFPRSLIPTASYIIVLAVGAWFLSKYISRRMLAMAKDKVDSERKTR